MLQINVLNQWDASVPYLRFPFKGGNYGNFELNEEYFDFAEKLLEKATQKGFIPALVLLWCNFVPDTWASQRGISPVIPFPVMEKYVEYAVKKFSKFEPIFIISGDTNFGSQETIRYYLRAMEIVKNLVPSALTTLHLQPNTQLPPEIVKSPYLDFYMYQSGHVKNEQHFPYLLAQQFLEYPVKRPIVNGEPCYEGHPLDLPRKVVLVPLMFARQCGRVCFREQAQGLPMVPMVFGPGIEMVRNLGGRSFQENLLNGIPPYI